MKRGRFRYWRRILVGNLIASAVVLFVSSDITWQTSARAALAAYLVALLFSMCIGPVLGFSMPRLTPWIWRRLRSPYNWAAVALVMIAIAIAGSVVAIGLLVAIGYVPAHDFGPWFENSIRVSIVLTLTIGLFITAYEMTRAREAHAMAQTQLASLESRVNPHFLFNTLNSISALIHDDPKGAERMTEQLASLMRTSLDQQATPLVSLDDELKIVRDYLAIEQVRFGDRLRYTIAVDEPARRVRVPRLALQTLVENSVKYAASAQREGAAIRIRASAAPPQRPAAHVATLTVEDDGPGFDRTSLPEGHGLALLRARLALLFRDPGAMRIESSRSGTRVTLTIPETHDKAR